MVQHETGQLPLVSVIMPVHNGERFLAGAIQHIKRQNYPALEIIVIDDGSTDGTSSIAKQFGNVLRYIYQEKKGSFAARNVGIKLAKGEIIAFLDVDDLWTENMLSKHVQYLRENPSVDICQGLIQEMTLDKACTSGELVFDESSEPYQFINVGSAVYRKKVFHSVGLFDETLKLSADTDWFYRAWRANVSKAVINEVALLYRKHDRNVTLGHGGYVHFGLLRLSKKYIDQEKKKDPAGGIPKGNLMDFRRFMGTPPKKLEKNDILHGDFTIVSNDCWGAGAYQRLGKIYLSPFIGTRIFAPCYLKLLQNLKGNMEKPIRFISQSKYAFMNQQRARKFHPIGLLNEEIEIHFHHEKTEAVAKDKWEKRKARINWEKIFVKFSEDPGVCTETMIQTFDELAIPNKVCFAQKEYPQLRSVICIPEYFEEGASMFWLSLKYFDAMGWLAQKRGSDVRSYLPGNFEEAV